MPPYMQDGQLTALEVKSVLEEVDKLDLQQGYLIAAINGVPATNHDEFSNAFEQIKYTQIVDIELLRDGDRYYKSYMLQR